MARFESTLGALDDFIVRGIADWEITGLAIGIVKDGEVVVSTGYGLRADGESAVVDDNTLFGIASCTKAFTATALGLLVQEKRIAWDDPVIKHLPGYRLHDPYVTREITVRDLLCHRSGLPTWGADFVAYGSCYDREELLRRARYIPPAFGFRGGFGYTNQAFLAAGQIIPAVTGLTWDEYVRQRIFGPLGMTRSNTSVGALEGLPNVAQPHEKMGDAVRRVPYRNVDNLGGAACINSTVRDLSQWLLLQLGNGAHEGTQVVDAAIIEETRTPHTPIRLLPAIRKLFPSRHFAAYGLGWGLSDYRGRLVVRHDGGLDGMISLVALLPEERLGLVALSNKLPHSFNDALFYHLVDACLDAPETDWNEAFRELQRENDEEAAERKQKVEEARTKAPHTLPLAGYAGTYKSPLYGEATIVEENGRLALLLSAHPDVRGDLEHWHYDTFMCRWSDPVLDRSLIPFVLDGQGRIEELRMKIREDWIDTLEYRFARLAASG